MPSPQDLIGVELNGQRGRYKLERFLGEGLTASVYVATATWHDRDEQEQVAVKLMRPGLGAQEASRYRAEATHLAELQSAQAAAAPMFYERFETGRPEAPEALVLELMRGRQVVDLLLAEGPLNEEEGLSLGLQLAELLQALHQQIGRTYTDFKFENLWWHEGQLKVTDWNVLSERGQLDRVSIDLLRASRYLYHILTGSDAREQGGIVVTPFMRHPRWATLSIACQNALRKGLHRYPDQRYQSAQEMVEALQQVQGYWRNAPDKLLLSAQRRVVDYHRTTFEQTQEMLDVLRRRETRGDRLSSTDQGQLDVLWNTVNKGLSEEENALKIGRHQFNGGSWQEAVKWFAQAVGDNPWDLAAWRWREAAQAGLVTSEYQGYKDDVAAGVDALNNHEFERAEQLLTRHGIPALSGLAAEARLRRLLQEGVRLTTQGKALVDQGQDDTPEADNIFKRAQGAFLNAADALKAVTPEDYRQQLQRDPEIGDPARRGRELVDQRRAAAAEAARRLRSAEDKARAGNWLGVVQDLNAGLEAVPGEVRLLKASLDYGQEQLRSGQPQVASDLLALASRYDDASDIRIWWRAAAGVAACSQLLGEHQWAAGLGVLDATIALPLAGLADEVRSAVAAPLQRALDTALEPAAASASLPELLHLLSRPAAVAKLDPSLASWARAVDQRWAELAAANVAARLPQHPLDMLEQARIALEAAPSDAIKAQLAQRLVEPLTQALKLAPASGEVDQAHEALQRAEHLLKASSELAASPWSEAVASYRDEFEQSQQERREARFQEDQRLIESLMKAGDKTSLEQARIRLDEAQKLTPAGSSQAEGLTILAKRLAQLEDQLLSGAERRAHIETLLAGFDERMARARSESDFADLDKELTVARGQAQSLQDSQLINAVSAKLTMEQGVRSHRNEAQQLEQALDDIRTRLAAAETLVETPGGAAAKDSLWRELNAAASDLLTIHPGHSDAVQAQQEFKQAVGALALHQRVAYVETVTGELGEPLQRYQQAEAYWRTAEPERAHQALEGLPADWRAMVRVQALAGRIEQGSQFLAAAQTVKQSDPLDEQFDQKLAAVLHSELPADYLAKADLAAWSKTKRAAAVQAWSTDGGRSASKAPRALALAVAADQVVRLVDRAQQGGPWPSEGPLPNVSDFVSRALAQKGRKDSSRSQIDALLQELPLTPQPAALGRQVGTAAKEQLVSGGQERRARLLKAVAAAANGLILLALLAAVAGWLWPGFLPNSRPSLLAAVGTATANPPTPRIERATVVVTVIVTATPTNTPTATVTPTETLTLTVTEPPAYRDIARIQKLLDDINVALALSDVTPVTDTVTITDVVAILDDGDANVIFNTEGIPQAELTPVDTLGVLDGMHFLDLASFTGNEAPVYNWPIVTSVPTGTYRLLVFIPSQHSNVDVDYSVELLQADGEISPLPIEQNAKRRLDQEKYSDQWINLGLFEVTKPGDLRIVAQATKAGQASSQAAFDAVAIVRSQ